MNAKVLNIKGEEIKSIDLNNDIFNIPNINKQSLYSSINSEHASWRQGTHSTKTKAEVSGGGKKPWAQKHTGNARQGSTRNPHWRHGGVAFGPKPNRNYTLKLNRKSHILALKSALTLKMKAEEIIILDDFQLNEFSTKKFIEILKTLDIANKKVLVMIDTMNDHLIKSLDNLKKVNFAFAKTASPRTILNNDVILTNEASLKCLEERLG